MAFKKQTNTQRLNSYIKVHNDTYDYSQTDLSLSGNTTIITIVCKTHGPFTMSPREHSLGKKCQLCKEQNSINK